MPVSCQPRRPAHLPSPSWRTPTALLRSARCLMSSEWSPHPRYRLYSRPVSYWLPLQTILPVPSGRGDTVTRFEAEVSRRFGVAAALCVPMARTGLYLALRELIRPGQTVIMSPLTIVDVVNMVLLAGGVPVF